MVIWMSWMDDFLSTGPKKRMQLAKRKIMSLYERDKLGEMKEYVGCKFERNWNERWLKLTKPAMVKSFQDELKLYTHGKVPMTQAETRKVLSKGDNKVSLSKEDQNTYILGVGKMLHMMRWSRPDILNTVCEHSMIIICTM